MLDVVCDVNENVADVIQILKIHQVFAESHLGELYALINNWPKSEKQKEDVVT